MENENVIGKVCFAILRKGFVAGLRISLELDSPGCIIGCKFDGAGIVGNTVIDDSDILLHITSHGIQTEKGHTTGDRSVFYIGVGAALSVNNQSVESSGITKDYKDALCEYVWNSFEANATAVAIDCIPNELTGSAEIVITDNGDGIAYDSLERTFGAFLDSQKNSRSLQIKTKANKGKGRFSCFSFASLAEWSTVTATPDGNIAYTISLENADKTNAMFLIRHQQRDQRARD